ncbi:hypothetical protein [Botrimarina sp.]|uniref:helix-turn-helix domain-containing protein n=1 Tax=Botrimarina sp. TaxID=2795802 RepID=UPI0032EA98CC
MANSTASDRQKAAYLDLVQRFPLRPIRSRKEHEGALAVIGELMDEPRLSRAHQDYLDVLACLVERYEQQADPIGPATDAQLLAHLMEAHGETALYLSNAVGIANTTISAVLRGKRKLTRAQVAALAAHYSVSTATFAG